MTVSLETRKKQRQSALQHGHGRNRILGKRESRTYHIWTLMRQRCHNPKNPGYKYYGARGIEVCEAWRYSFVAFLKDMGEAPEGMSIERVNNNGNYEPANCKWIPLNQQAHNQRTNKMVTWCGVTYHQEEWMRRLGWTTASYIEAAERHGSDAAIFRHILRKMIRVMKKVAKEEKQRRAA